MASPIRLGGAAQSLYSATITTPGTATGGTVTNLAGATYAALHVNFTYGSGGTTGTAFVQTSLDRGGTWMDVAAVGFAQTSLKRVFTIGPAVSSGTAIVTPAAVTLAANTQVPGILGDRLRTQVVTAGTYAGNTSLAVDVVVK